MAQVADRIHFYYNGHTYEIEPASLNHGDAWYNATGLAHGMAEGGTLLSQLYDSDLISTPWSQWNLIKTADEVNDNGTITYWYVGVEDTNVISNSVENEDGSSSLTYSSDKIYPDGTIVSYSLQSSTNADGSGTSLAKYTYPDGRVVDESTVTTLDGDTLVTSSTTTTSLPGGSTIDFPQGSAEIKKGGGVQVNSVASNIYSYLANINSSAENDLILKQAKAIYKLAPVASDGGGSAYLWLGGTDDSNNSWYWVGLNNYEQYQYAGIDGDYKNWGSGAGGAEPDNPGIQGGLAIALEQWPKNSGSIGQAGEWNNLNQDNILYSVIEWNGIIGTDGKDRLQSTSADAVVHAGNEKDQIKTLGGDDLIYAGEGDDLVSAGSGNDLILGGGGIDKIDAGSGDDIVISGGGNEKIKGGAGDDLFILDSLTAEDIDIYLDFNPSDDKFVLDSNVFTSFNNDDAEEGEPAFHQVLANEFLRGPGFSAPSTNETGVDDYLVFDTRSGRLYYDADGNEEGGAEPVLIATLKGKVASLDFDNFIIV